MKFQIPKTDKGEIIEGLLIFEPKIFQDKRGYFMEMWNQKRFNSEIGEKIIFVQDNCSFSHKGVLRGLHYQNEPFAQGKLVQCLKGEIYDVAVDLRRNSKTFGKWLGVFLNSTKHNQLWIPEGFAHGFLTMTTSAQVLYKTTNFWSKEHEVSLKWNDENIAISWPKSTNEILVSEKDNDAISLIDLHSNQLFK